MRSLLRLGLLGLTIGLSACAGAGESPTMADALFPIPYLMKQQRAKPLPPYSGGGVQTPAPTAYERIYGNARSSRIASPMRES
jgi:hypothetical protein